jgi:cytochrome c oxidase subunit IV
MLFFNFMLLSFVILFYFLVKIEFLFYLKLCKPLKKVGLIIIIFRKIKLVNLRLTFATFLPIQPLCALCLIVVFSFHLHQ